MMGDIDQTLSTILERLDEIKAMLEYSPKEMYVHEIAQDRGDYMAEARKKKMPDDIGVDISCPKCKGRMHYVSGIKKETGRAWHAYFCNNKACRGVRWANADKSLK